MSQYSWSKRYEIPSVCFKTQRNSYQAKCFQHKLRETIDIGTLRIEDQKFGTVKTKPSFAESFRHSTSNTTSLSELLGKNYEYFEPRSQKPKLEFKNTSIEDYNSHIDKKLKSYQSFSSHTWSEARLKSFKELPSDDKQLNKKDLEKRNQLLWNSTKEIPLLLPQNQNIKTPQKKHKLTETESSSTFLKKQKFYYTTPQPNKQQLDQVSTKFGSPTNSCQPQNHRLILKEVQKKTIKPCLAEFFILKHLGEGRFGAVSMAVHKKCGLLVAIKRVRKLVIKAHQLQNQFLMQIKMQLFLKHPNILKMYGCFDDQENIYMILEFMEEGTLFNKLKKEKDKRLDQKTASHQMDDVLQAIQYMHELEIAHRDIKPQNIVISNVTHFLFQGVSKLCDFGWAVVCQNRRTTLCGTIDYTPPELLEGKQYGLTMDLWCLGVLCYELLVGKAPFYHASKKKTMQKIIKADTNGLALPQHLSSEAIDFISKMLVKNPDERMFADEALKHEFILKYQEKEEDKLRGSLKK